MEVLIFIAGVVFGIIIVKFFSNNKGEEKIFSKKFDEEFESTKKQLAEERSTVIELNKKIAAIEANSKNLLTKIQTEEDIQKKFILEFQNVASKILKENTEEFSNTNKKELSTILDPLKSKINDFEKKVEEKYSNEAKERSSLERYIKMLSDQTQLVSNEASNLAKALKGQVKTQGCWGEVILEKILEMSGLQENQEFSKQVRIKTQEGSYLQPDIIIHLPDNKHIVIDSKVSLVSYERLFHCDNDDDKTLCLKEFLTSTRNHIKGLSDKFYQNIDELNTPDYVLLFVPIESSFSLIVQNDTDLVQYAWGKNIVLVSPSTLLAALRTINLFWQQERQTRNVIEIAKESGKLYDKFVNLLSDLEKVQGDFNKTQASFENAMKKLEGRGNLIRQVERIKSLGASASKSIPDKYLDEDESENLYIALDNT